MKLTLMIEGNANVIAAILASLPNDGSGAVTAAPLAPQPAMPIAAGVTVPVGSMATTTLAPASTDDEDDNGPADSNAPAVDNTGLPWDERIHSSNRKIKADGTWTRRKGVQDATVAAVTAELRAAAGQQTVAGQPIPAPIQMPQTMPIASQPSIPAAPLGNPVVAPIPQSAPAVMAPVMAVAAPVCEQPAAAPMQQPPMMQPVQALAPQPVAAANPTAPMDIAQFMQHIGTKMQQTDADGMPLIHADYLNGVAQEIGTAFGQHLGSLTDIAGNPQMIGYAVQILQRDGRW